MIPNMTLFAIAIAVIVAAGFLSQAKPGPQTTCVVRELSAP